MRRRHQGEPFSLGAAQHHARLACLSLVLVCVSELVWAPSSCLTILVEAKDTQTLLRRGRAAKKMGHTRSFSLRALSLSAQKGPAVGFLFLGQEGGMSSDTRCF